jgi:predicted glutamine amidotransferase
MCGLAGWVGNPADDGLRLRVALLMQVLFFPLQSRGKDGAGYVVSDGVRHHVRKKALKPSEFVYAGNTEALFGTEYRYLLAHAREATIKATAGRDRNSHPFAVKIGDGRYSFGIHNGRVGRSDELAEKYGIRLADVDSESMFRAVAALQRWGAKAPDAISEIVEFISDRSEFACAYLDTGAPEPEDRALYLWRSEGRPLFVFDARSIGLGRFFCSTKEIFQKGWAYLRGYLGPLSAVGVWETKPFRLYRAAADGVCEVDGIGDMPHRAVRKSASVHVAGTGRTSYGAVYSMGSRFGSTSPDIPYGQEPFFGDYIRRLTGGKPGFGKGACQPSLFREGVKGPGNEKR